MELSLFLARFLGLYLIITGIFYIVRRKTIQKISVEMMNQPSLIILTGLFSLLFGLFIVISHSVWTFDWPILITLLGYLAVLKGIFRLFFETDRLKGWVVRSVSNKKPIYIGALVFLLGLYLAYKGFFTG